MKSGPFCVVCKKEVSSNELADCEKENTYGVYCGSCLENLSSFAEIQIDNKKGKTMDKLITFQIGNKNVEATYDDWEELFEKLEGIFGESAVIDIVEEKLDKLDVEIYCDQDISEN